MGSYTPEAVRSTPATTAQNLSDGDATITELDRAAWGNPRFVTLSILTGDVAATAVLDVFSVHGADTGTITPGAGNLIGEHAPVAAHATNNDNKEFSITVDCKTGPRYLDAIISNNVAANFVILSARWIMSDPTEVPNTNAYGPDSPVFAVAGSS